MLFTASVEILQRPPEAALSLNALEAGIDRDDPGISPTMLYAYAALREGVPFVNGTPNPSVELPAFQELARDTGVPTYSYPPDEAPFQPTQELNVLLASKSDDPGPVRNDYWNSVHYVDALIGELLERIEAEKLLDDTIVVITGDHGEEFNDTNDNSWGHTGNFTKFQSQVPLIVYVPWLKPRQVTAVTSQLDIPPTLMQEGLGCGNDVSDYSNGVNLFGPLPDRRAVVVSSYVNHAFILGDGVFVSWPLYMQRYKLDGSKDKVGWPTGPLKGMGRFYGREERH